MQLAGALRQLVLAASSAAREAADGDLFAVHRKERNAKSLLLAAILGGVLVPFFWALDWWILPGRVWESLPLRLITPVFAVFLVVAVSRWPAWATKNVDGLSAAFAVIIAWTIAVLCWLHSGYESPYYAGLNLVIVGVGLVFSWSLTLSLAFCVLVYAFYMTPLVLGLIPLHNAGVTVSNQFFLVATMVIITAAQHHRLKLESRAFYANLDLQRTKASLEQAVTQLKEMDRVKSDFFNNITHELRTPLTVMLAPLDGLIEGELGHLDPAQRKGLRPIRRAAMKLLRLINNLLDVAKLEERYLRLRIERTDLVALLSEIVDHARPLAERKDIALRLEVCSSRDDLWVDIEQLERVIINLLSNALKFTGGGGQVAIVLDSDEEQARITVRDTGVGIEPHNLERIFERFNQGDTTTTRRYGGTGIGLSLAKEIIELHKGWITVESAKGEGSTFCIHLRPGKDHFDPSVLDRRASDEPTLRQERGEDREPVEWARRLQERADFRFLELEEVTERRITLRDEATPKATKILVVEDNIEVLRLLHMQLQQHHSVYLARDGKQGLELAKSEHPDIIITDYMMPEMDGLALLKALHEDPATAEIPTIMLTARARVEDRLSARHAGADIYLSKPFNPRELRAAITQLLEKRGRYISLLMREHVKSLEMISAGLAHEINNPVSFIRNSLVVITERVDAILKTLAQEELDAAQRQAAIAPSQQTIVRMRDVAHRGLKRIEEVIELVRRYAREGYPDKPTPVVLDDAVTDVGRLVASREGAEVENIVNLAAAGVKVRCIPEEMHQAIRNLWQNALDAVGPGGHVWVRTYREDEAVYFEVRDDGPGMAPEQLRRIFTPFYTTKAPGKGMGLGLAITHQAVERARGVLSVESRPGAGTIFRIVLPVAKEKPAEPAVPEAAQAPDAAVTS